MKKFVHGKLSSEFGCKTPLNLILLVLDANLNGDLQNIMEKIIQFSVDKALEIEEES